MTQIKILILNLSLKISCLTINIINLLNIDAIADLIEVLIQRTFFSNMDTFLILQTLRTLPTQDRRMIAETALKFIWQEQQSLTPMQRKIQLMLAAITAISDYQPDSDLLAFSALDGEDFLQD